MSSSMVEIYIISADAACFWVTDRVDVKMYGFLFFFFPGVVKGEELRIIWGRAYLGKLLWEYLNLVPHISKWMTNDGG